MKKRIWGGGAHHSNGRLPKLPFAFGSLKMMFFACPLFFQASGGVSNPGLRNLPETSYLSKQEGLGGCWGKLEGMRDLGPKFPY